MGVLQPPSSGAGAQMHVSEAGELGSRAARPALERHTTSVYKLLMAAAEGARSSSSVVVVVEHVLTLPSRPSLQCSPTSHGVYVSAVKLRSL